MTGLSVAEIAARLNARIADLARALLGEPNRALSTATQLRFGHQERGGGDSRTRHRQMVRP